jgi:hypothetical protein
MRAASCAVAAGMLAALCACGASDNGGTVTKATASAPVFDSGFADDLAAQMTASGERLWVAVAGRPSLRARDKEASFRMFALSDSSSSWSRVSLPLDSIDTSEPFFVAPWGKGVCVAASRHQRPVILCSHDGRSWTRIASALSGRDTRIVDLASSRSAGTLAVALSQSKLLTIRIGDDAQAQSAAQPMPGGPLLARLGGDPERPMLATRRANGEGALSIYELRDGTWTPSAAPIDVGVGPQLGGPVADGDDVLIPVVQAGSAVWPLRVARLSAGKLSLGPSVNRGDGSAQGLLEPGASHPVAIWQQHSAGHGRTFRASIYVKDISGSATKPPRLIWSGYDIGPGDLAIQSFGHRLWSLTTRARPGHVDKALRVYVSPLAAA